MILEAIFNLVKGLLELIFALLPDVPDLDITLLDSLTTFIEYVFNNLGLLGFFIRISTIKALVPLIIIAANFEHIYHFALWILKKLPIATE